MRERGYPEADVEKILGGNLLRVLEQARSVAERLGTVSAGAAGSGR